MSTLGGASIRGIDTHAHIFHRGLALVPNRRYAPDYDALPEDYLAQLAAHGLSHGVLVQPSFLGVDNRFMLDALQRHPGVLRGIAVVATDVAAAQLDEMAAQGVVGVRLNLLGGDLPDLGARPWQVLLQKLAERHWLVEVQRHARDLPLLLPPLLDAGLRVVIDHLGLPDPALGLRDPGFGYLLSLAAHRAVWVKTSAPYRSPASAEMIDAWVAALKHNFGPQRLLWGSDWPHTRYEQQTDYAANLACLARWFPEQAERDRVLIHTPAMLFGFDRIEQGMPACAVSASASP